MAGAERRGNRIGMVEAAKLALAIESARVADLIERGRRGQEDERRRREAMVRAASGDPASAADAVLPPTPEWLGKGESRQVAAPLDDWTGQRVKTWRRVSKLRIVQLLERGLIDEDLFAACRWYRSAWERSGLDRGASIAAYDADPRGERLYGVMARTEAQAEARADYRFARSTIPAMFVDLFDSIVLEERTIEQAAALARIRKRTARNRFIAAALALHGGIAHLLPVRLTGSFCIGPKNGY